MFTGHGEGEQYHRASPPLTGMPPGVAVGLGVRVNPRVALEAEVVVDGTLSASQADVYFTRTDYTAQSRDILLGATLRFRPGRGSPVEFTAGGGTAFSRFARRDIVETRTFPPGVTRWPDAETSTWEPTLTGSVAIAMRLSPHVQVVPSIGVRWIRRGFDTDAWYFGLGRTMVLVGAAFRVRP